MAQSWQTVRVFISSTFRDMHAERDHLVRVVFPELKERCRQRRVHLIDVDLRWGVTQEQAEGGGALDICLDEIDSCRPYFLGLLGHRYGSIPPGHDQSITAAEIYHGVLHNSLPRQLMDLRPFVRGILEGRALYKEQVETLVRCYQWDPQKKKHLLQHDITPEDEKTLRSIFDQYSLYQRDRSFFYFRSESLTGKLAGSNARDFWETDDTLKSKLETLKGEIERAGLPVFKYQDLESFGQKVLETLWQRIDAEFPEKREVKRDWLEEEAEFHELFMADRTRRFVGRSDILKDMHDFVEKDSEPRLMVVTGEPGCGKSALMARFTEESIHDHPDWLIIPHFVGASPSSTNLRRTLRRLCTHLNRVMGVTEEAPEDHKELAQLFPQLLERASERQRILLVIDAVNQFDRADNAHTMRWLPQHLPQNARVLLSTLDGKALDALKTRHIQPRLQAVSGLKEDDIRQLAAGYLGEIRRKFPTEDITQVFYEKVKAGNPLFIIVALEELRVFPYYDKLAKRVAELPDTVPKLFDQVLQRLEGDFNRPLVQDFTSLIACGRHGMTAEELQMLLKGHAVMVDPANPPARLPDMLLARLRRALSAYLFERSGVIDFFHGQLKEAVGQRYLAAESDRDDMHRTIADYFEQRWREPNLRAVDELPHQLTKAKAWEGLERVLCDLRFVEAKCASGMTYDLVHDYNAALDPLPEAEPERQERLRRKARLKKYTEDLIAYAKGEINTLEIIPSVRPWTDEEIRADNQRVINNPTRLDRIRAFSQFVNSESHALLKFGSHPGFTSQHAYNAVRTGPVARAADYIISGRTDHALFLRLASQRPEYNAHPALLKTLEGHTSSVLSVALAPDGRSVVSGSSDGILNVWDVETGQRFRTIEGHDRKIVCVALTPDGRKAVCGSREEPISRLTRGEADTTLQVWDLETGLCLNTLQGHTEKFDEVFLAPDGLWAISKSSEQTLRVWDLETGKCVSTFKGSRRGSNGAVFTLALTPDGRRAVSGSLDGALRVWDLKGGRCLGTLKGHRSLVVCVALTPDGRRAVSGSSDGLRVWDLEAGKCIRTLEGLFGCVAVTPDGRRAVSGVGDENLLGPNDRALRVWDLEAGKCIRTLERNTYEVGAVAITPDGRRAVSATRTFGEALRVWDLETGQCLGMPERHECGVGTVAITSDGRRAVSATRDPREALRVWDLGTGQCVRAIKGGASPLPSLALAVTPDGRTAVCGTYQLIRVLDLESGQCLKILKGHAESVMTVSLTPDGRRAVSASFDRTLRVWDLESGQCLRTLVGHTRSVESVSLTPDGRRAVSASEDRTLRVWDLESGQCLWTLEGHTDPISILRGWRLSWSLSVNVTPDGRRAVSAGADQTLRVWDPETGRCLRTLGRLGPYTALSPDGRRAVFGTGKGLKVQNLETVQRPMTVEGHEGIRCGRVAITPDGRRAVSGSDGNTLMLWDLETGGCRVVCHVGAEVTFLAVTSNWLVVCGTDAGEVLFMTCRGLDAQAPLATPVLVWLHGEETRLAGSHSMESSRINGRWDDTIKTTCPWCSQRFPVAEGILDVIRAINRNANLSPDQSPCLDLPKEAWDDLRLLSECPLCHKPLKFNPFIVDNRERY